MSETKCDEGYINFISYDNINAHFHAYRKGLHLNGKGVNYIVRNFLTFLKNG